MLNKQDKTNTFQDNNNYIDKKKKFQIKWKTLTYLKQNNKGF